MGMVTNKCLPNTNAMHQPNLCINCDKYPADYCVNFYGSEVLSVFNFVVGYLRVMRVVRIKGKSNGEY